MNNASQILEAYPRTAKRYDIKDEIRMPPAKQGIGENKPGPANV